MAYRSYAFDCGVGVGCRHAFFTVYFNECTIVCYTVKISVYTQIIGGEFITFQQIRFRKPLYL